MTPLLRILWLLVVASYASPCEENLLLFGGRIHTFDNAGTVANFVRIRNEEIVEVGFDTPIPDDCEVPIFLNNATVIPGLVDSHGHTTGFGTGPTGVDFCVGYYFREMDMATSKQDILNGLANRIQQVPDGAWVWGPQPISSQQYGGNSFMPTQSELDAVLRETMRPNIKVFIQSTVNGPAIVSSNGEAWIRELDPTIRFNPVGNNPGQIGTGNPQGAPQISKAADALDTNKTFEERLLIRKDFYDYAASLGVTTILDLTPINGVLMGTFEPLLEMLSRRILPVRIREFIQSMSDLNLFRTSVATMIDQQYLPDHPLLKFVGFGERVIRTSAMQPNPDYDIVLDAIAALQMPYCQHNTFPDNAYFISKWMNVSQFYDISGLRFNLVHVGRFEMRPDLMQQLISIGGGVSVQATQRTVPSISPIAFKTLFDTFKINGQARLGMGSDGPYTLGVFHPWLGLDFVVNGIDSAGDVQVPVAQRLSVQEAIEAHTRGSSWLGHVDEAGSIEVGKFGDLVVLDRDIFSGQFDTRTLKQVRPLMTILGGEIVHDQLKNGIM